MDKIKVFRNYDFEVRVTMKDDEFWFVGKDVAEALGYSDTFGALKKHVDNEDKTTMPIQQSGSNYKTTATIINESGLYSLILSSKLPTAKRFKRWVTSEVLPMIRKFGAYTFYLPQTYNEALVALGDIAKKNIDLQNQLEKAKPKVEFADAITSCETSIPIGLFAKTIAKELDIGRNRLFEKLREWNLLMTLPSEYNKPTQRAIALGIFEIEENKFKDNLITTKVKITPKGQLYIYKRLKGYVYEAKQTLCTPEPDKKPLKMTMPLPSPVLKEVLNL